MGITLNHYIVNGLDMGEKYIFRVRAVNSKGSSAFSEASEPVCAYDGIRPPFWYGNALSFFRLSRTDGKPDVTKTNSRDGTNTEEVGLTLDQVIDAVAAVGGELWG